MISKIPSKMLPVLDHKEKGLSDPESNFNQLVEFYGEDLHLLDMATALIPSFRREELLEDSSRGAAFFKRLFPEDAHILTECVISELPRAEIMIDKDRGLYFVERMKLHPAFYMTEEGERLLSDTRTELENFNSIPWGIVEAKIRIGCYAAPFLEISTRKLVRSEGSMEFAVRAIHTVIQKQREKIGGEPEW